jgi:hypothetical protein
MLGPNMFVDGTNSPSSRSRSLSVERTKANSVVMKKTSKVGLLISHRNDTHLKYLRVSVYQILGCNCEDVL